jgi:hypothetical protein
MQISFPFSSMIVAKNEVGRIGRYLHSFHATRDEGGLKLNLADMRRLDHGAMGTAA